MISGTFEGAYKWEIGGERSNHVYLWPAVKGLLARRRRLRILDAGCGSGFIAAQLAALGHQVIGVDASVSGIKLARASYPDVQFELRSVYDNLLSLAPPGGWDLIISLEVIEHLFSPQQFLDNMRNPLQPAGVLLVSTPYHGYVKNLALSVTNGWDRHHIVDWECGHIKFFFPQNFSTYVVAVGLRTFDRQIFWPSTVFMEVHDLPV